MNLKTYLAKNEFKPTPWALKHSISPSVISRYLAGRRLSPENAERIERATDGEVSRMELLYKK